MRWLEDSLNWLSDIDWGWWPMLFLRPAKNEVMTTPRILKISVYYGTIGAIVVAIPFILRFLQCDDCFLLDNAPLTLLAFAFYMYTFMFLLYRFIFSIAWNNRAMRLQKKKRKPQDLSALESADDEIDLQALYIETSESQQRS
ncbi:MAG: hypothetical protein Q9P01_17270 [Anaerolineae bacterium]|nr:hypothetical protein [Anaerolineae bacterium]MDQ7036512.1 hypothetical protein [Anaerolineae bacterium]